MADFPTEGSPPFINRRLSISEWKAYVAGYAFGRFPPSRLVLHHTYRPDEPQWAGLSTMRGMQRFYASKGWTAAPHIYTGPDGIWLATPMSRVGIHAGTGNGSVAQGWYSIGLELVGAFDRRLPSGPVWEYALAVMGELSRRLGIPPRQLISFHRDYTNQKSCPGWAVTKEWVWGQVEAYMRSDPGRATLAPPAPGPIGTPTPADEELLEALREQSFGRRTGGQGYNANWAFHQYAAEQGLGAPMGPSQNLAADGKTYNYQVFARDTLFCEVPNWGDVRSLADLLGGSIPPAGLGRALLDATFRAGGAAFRPDWSFHQFALINRLGPPVGTSLQITVDGRQYAYQAFAADTIYNLVPNWGDVRRLSDLASAAEGHPLRLREALLAETYRQAGTTYHPEWSFHQLARGFRVGAPLSDSYQIKLGGTSYAIQVYALDTLFNVVPNWSAVRRMSSLAPSPAAPVLGGEVVLGASMAAGDERAVVVTGDFLPPADVDHRVIRYSPQATACGERRGRRVELVILHGVAGAEAEALGRMTALGSRFATHYYVSSEGEVYQLVDEGKAAWHAGFGLASGTWYNLNLTSIGVALERPAGWPEAMAGNTEAQTLALRGLLRRLDARYRIAPEGLVLWSSFMSSDEESLDGLPVSVLREALAR